jgi:hypothetical protein
MPRRLPLGVSGETEIPGTFGTLAAKNPPRDDPPDVSLEPETKLQLRLDSFLDSREIGRSRRSTRLEP